jgi:hypothetical protein
MKTPNNFYEAMNKETEQPVSGQPMEMGYIINESKFKFIRRIVVCHPLERE